MNEAGNFAVEMDLETKRTGADAAHNAGVRETVL
jgi:hypothetical protein